MSVSRRRFTILYLNKKLRNKLEKLLEDAIVLDYRASYVYIEVINAL